jgi:hypothetical protein
LDADKDRGSIAAGRLNNVLYPAVQNIANGTEGTSATRPTMSVPGEIVLQKSFAGSVKNSEGRWRVLRVMIRGTSSPCAKFMGDFGSATEAVRIIDLFALQVFAKNFDRCNFRVLQHNRHFSDMPPLAPHVRC